MSDLKVGDYVNYPRREFVYEKLKVTVINKQGWIFLQSQKNAFAVRLTAEGLSNRIAEFKALEAKITADKAKPVKVDKIPVDDEQPKPVTKPKAKKRGRPKKKEVMHKVKLYNVPNNTKINVEHLNISLDGVKIEVMDFDHIDGAFALCYFNRQ